MRSFGYPTICRNLMYTKTHEKEEKEKNRREEKRKSAPTHNTMLKCFFLSQKIKFLSQKIEFLSSTDFFL